MSEKKRMHEKKSIYWRLRAPGDESCRLSSSSNAAHDDTALSTSAKSSNVTASGIGTLQPRRYLVMSAFEPVVLSGSSGSSVAESFMTSCSGIPAHGDAGTRSYDRDVHTTSQLTPFLQNWRLQL